MTLKETLDPTVLPEWQPIVSGNAELKLSAAYTARLPALQMDFDFKGAGGFVVARSMLSRQMPKEYAVSFMLRGRGATNDLELKLVDASGQNVWRYVKKEFHLPPRWKRMRVESRDIDFAWGPSSGSDISQLGSIEIAIVAGEGGKGRLWIADVQIEDCTPSEASEVSASSALPGFEASGALGETGWRPDPDDARPWLVIDSTQPRMIGGLVIDWLSGAPASGFRIRASNSGRRWKTVYVAKRAGGNHGYVYLPGLKTRFLRLEIAESSKGAVVRLQPFGFSRSIHAFWHQIAEAEARAWHPRWLHREQSVWTPIGRSNGVRCALINGDGMVEVDQGSCSIEPMLLTDGRLFTWADFTSRQELLEEWMPVPTVIWEGEHWHLRTWVEATVGGQLRVHYRVDNLAALTLSARLFLVVRPFQVTPPWQNFRALGGVSPIHRLCFRDGALRVNESTLIVPEASPTGFGAMCFDEGFIVSHLLAGALPSCTQVHDPFGFATGALEFALSIDAGGCGERAVHCSPSTAMPGLDTSPFDWSHRVAATQWAGNGWISGVIRATLTATAHVLVTRSGPALQPGPRRYTRSWIRDGAMMSAALLRMRHLDEVREFIRWYAPHQRADGFVPCCVDNEGVDWLVEHDSHGQLLALIADYYRFSADEELLAETWVFVERAVRCIEGLLGVDGLLPISVSHEGYLAQPVHSYWDDFWALRGLRDAVVLARASRHAELAQRWEALAARFAASLFASIEATRAQHKLAFVPGSIEWADFDPTATANAIYLHDVPIQLNREAIERTFDMYLADWRRKRSGSIEARNYTPYEIRIIGALVRLGRRDAALELLRFFLTDRRPVPWNQWPEIAWRDQKAPAHLGDLPHTWISAEYVLAVRSLFAYERESDESLILGAGLAPEWIEGPGVQVDRMPTLYGDLTYSLRRIDTQTLRFEIRTRSSAKVILRPPLGAPLRRVVVNGGEHADFDVDGVVLTTTPADVICTSYQLIFL